MEVPGDPAPVPVLGGEKEAKEGRGVRASRCACVLPQEVLSNLAFQCLIWEVGGRTSQGSG